MKTHASPDSTPASVNAAPTDEAPPAPPTTTTTTPSTAPPAAAAATKRPRAARPRAIPMVQPARAASAYYALLPRLIAVTPEELAGAPAELDLPAAVAGVLAALPAVRALRPRITAELPRHPVACLDELEDLAHAAWFAHVREEMSGEAAPDLAALAARGQQLREDLLIAGEALARKALLDPARLGAIRAHDATVDLAADLLALFELFLWNWAAVQNKTAVTQEEVAEAGDLAQRMIVALAQQKEAAASPGVGDFRGRALVLLARAWDECARAVAYLRWHEDDAAETTPALFGRRARGASAPRRGRAAAGGAKGEASDKSEDKAAASDASGGEQAPATEGASADEATAQSADGAAPEAQTAAREGATDEAAPRDKRGRRAEGRASA